MTATDLTPRCLGGGRVLVVDNCEDSAACLTAVLRLNGFDAVSVRTGREALRALASHRPGAAIIDFDLPDADACAIIREVSAKTNPPAAAIVLTAYTDAKHRLAAATAGAAAYLVKPAEPVALVQLLQDLCPPPSD